MSKIVILTILCLLLVENVFSLNCYVSTQVGDSAVVEEKKVACTSPEKATMKCVYISTTIDETKVSIRGCAPDGCQVKSISSIHCAECKEDYCNKLPLRPN